MAANWGLTKLVTLDSLALAVALSDVVETAELDPVAMGLLSVTAGAGEDLHLCRVMVDR